METEMHRTASYPGWTPAAIGRAPPSRLTASVPSAFWKRPQSRYATVWAGGTHR